MRQEDEEAMAERMSNPYGEAGFGVGEVLGRGAAKRQQEILTGAEYSANQAPPGYRPGFDPEYLYFGDPRYSDYAALLPGVYGQPPVAGTPPVAAPPVAGMPDIGGLPRGSLENLTQANVEDAMKLIAGGQYDIYSLADELELDRGTAMTAYDKYLRDTFGMGTFNPNVDELSEDDIQKYFGIANQQGYSPEQISRIFGIPLDQSRSSLAGQYFKDIPVDEDYSDNEAQQVYDLYSSGRMGVTGISNYFGIPSADVQRILGDIEGAGGIVANIPGADTTTSNTTDTTTANTATANTATADTATVASPLAGIEVDGDYSSTEADQVYDMYVAGQVTPLQISQYFDIPLGEIDSAIAQIGESRSAVAGSTTGASEDSVVTPVSTALDLYNAGTAIPQDQIREALVYAQANGISFSELDRMFDAPDGSAQDAAAALGLAASSGGIVGMAEGREVGAYDESYSYPYGVDAGMQESLEIVDKITDLENSMSIEKDSDKRRRLEMELDSLKKFGGAVNGISKRDFTNFVEVQKLKNKNQSQTESTGMAEGGGFPDLSGDGEITQEDILMGRGVINKAEGGYIGRDQLDGLIKMTRDAILGDAENADQVIQEFISVFGNEAFQQLREQVLQTQVPDAQTEGMIEGQGGGMDDEIMGMIGNQQPVAVSPGEYIVPADVVASLGDGSSDAGSSKLDTMLDDVRMAKTGRTIQPGKINDRVIPA